MVHRVSIGYAEVRAINLLNSASNWLLIAALAPEIS
jgi:hypothetical protein